MHARLQLTLTLTISGVRIKIIIIGEEEWTMKPLQHSSKVVSLSPYRLLWVHRERASFKRRWYAAISIRTFSDISNLISYAFKPTNRQIAPLIWYAHRFCASSLTHRQTLFTDIFKAFAEIESMVMLNILRSLHSLTHSFIPNTKRAPLSFRRWMKCK